MKLLTSTCTPRYPWYTESERRKMLVIGLLSLLLVVVATVEALTPPPGVVKTAEGYEENPVLPLLVKLFGPKFGGAV